MNNYHFLKKFTSLVLLMILYDACVVFLRMLSLMVTTGLLS